MLTMVALASIIACARPAPPPIPFPFPSPTPDVPRAIKLNLPFSTPISAQAPLYLTASVWQTDPVVPILLYHRFKDNNPSTPNIISRVDFLEELETLYVSGYVTVSLEKWLAGDFRVPEGKRPIVLSMDDLFYRNQIVLTSDGIPSDQTGLGMAWKFSQEHPDFGFHWALFANFGDKPFGEGTQAEQDIQLANVMVWCLENDAMIYNHTYRHSRLNRTDGLGLTSELKLHDVNLRRLLTLVNRQDLVSKPGNLFAVPAGQWPDSAEALNALYGYKNPEGIPLQAILDVDFITRPNFMKAPYAKKFDPWKLPRMVADRAAIKYLAENKDVVPAAHACEVGPLNEIHTDRAIYMSEQILGMVQSGKCPEGVYALENFVFRANAAQVELLLDFTMNQ